MYGSSKIISGTFILRIQLLIIIGVSIQLKFKHFKKCLNNTFHCGFRQWIRCQMHVPFFKRNNLRAFSLFYMFLISIAMWMLSAPPPPPLWRDSHAERKETPWWVMRITKSKYTRGKMPPSPPACRVQWPCVQFGKVWLLAASWSRQTDGFSLVMIRVTSKYSIPKTFVKWIHTHILTETVPRQWSTGRILSLPGACC